MQSVSATKLVDAVLPSAPSVLTATAVSSNRVDLNWTDNSGNETGFTIERALVTGGVPGPFTAIDGVGMNITTYSDPTAAPSTTYAYRVFAFNGAGNSQPSNVATVTTPAAPPAAPGNLTASVLSNPTRVQLSWTDNSNNENLFQVWRSTNGGAFSNIGTVTRTNTQRTAIGGSVNFTNNLPGGQPVIRMPIT